MDKHELNIDILLSCLRTTQELQAAGLATEQDVEAILNNLKEYKEQHEMD